MKPPASHQISGKSVLLTVLYLISTSLQYFIDRAAQSRVQGGNQARWEPRRSPRAVIVTPIDIALC
jgi:hypothetical protein